MPAQLKILIGEHKPEAREELRSILEEKYVLTLCANGKEVKEQLDNDPPDLVILNLTLPFHDGLELCEVIKGEESLKKTLVILVSDFTEKEDLPDAFWQRASGADAFLSRPFKPERLRALIVELVEKKIGKQEFIGPGFF